MTETGDLFGQVIEAIAASLGAYGFKLASTHVRVRGVAAEFRGGKSWCFVSMEGEALYFDLIVKTNNSNYRVSLDEAMWRDGGTWRQTVAGPQEHAEAMSKWLAAQLGGVIDQTDFANSPFSYPLTDADLSLYLDVQRGQSGTA